MRLLLVEDNRDLASNIIEFFESRRSIVDWAADGVSGLQLAIYQTFDVLILDLGLPGMDGIDLCQKLRALSDRPIRILIISARDCLNDKLSGFDNGADDYLVKPFELKELEARVKALSRRSIQLQGKEIANVGPLSYNAQTQEFFHGGQLLSLPPIPHRILRYLITNSGRLVDKDELLSAVWPDDLPNSDAIRTHMHTLRRIVDKPFNTCLVKTLPGLGYRLVHDANS